MIASVRRVALGFAGVLAVAGCSGDVSANGADEAARRVVRCLDGRPFWLVPTTHAAPASRARLGTIHAGAATLTKSPGDAGFVEASIPLDYEADAAGSRLLAARGICAPGVRCFPTTATAELYPADLGGYDYSLGLVDTFAPYRGGRVIALAANDLHARGERPDLAGSGPCPS